MHYTCLIDFIHNYRMAGASVNTPVGGLEVLVMFKWDEESHNHLNEHGLTVETFFRQSLLLNKGCYMNISQSLLIQLRFFFLLLLMGFWLSSERLRFHKQGSRGQLSNWGICSSGEWSNFWQSHSLLALQKNLLIFLNNYHSYGCDTVSVTHFDTVFYAEEPSHAVVAF